MENRVRLTMLFGMFFMVQICTASTEIPVSGEAIREELHRRRQDLRGLMAVIAECDLELFTRIMGARHDSYLMLNLKSSDGSTLLMQAIRERKPDFVEWLLKTDCLQLSIKNNRQKTAADVLRDMSALYPNDADMQKIRTLLRAEIDRRNKAGVLTRFFKGWTFDPVS
jgi:hypothetical protein